MSDAVVFCYHAVSSRWPAVLSVTPEQLRSHLAMLRRRGYRGVTFVEAVTAHHPGKVAAITFDDAYRSVGELAFPILSEAGFPGTVFAPTDFIGGRAPMSWPGIDGWVGGEFQDELASMSWEELERLANSGWEIGSHTRSHAHLPGLDAHALAGELSGSRLAIEERLGPCLSIAYPYGDHDARVIEAAREAGYRAAGTLPRGLRWSGDPLAYPRIGIYHVDDNRRFRVKASRIARRARSSRGLALLDAIRRRGPPHTAAPDAPARRP